MTTIAALRYISMQDLHEFDNSITEMYLQQHKDGVKALSEVLWMLGLDTNQPFEHQVNTHRSMLINRVPPVDYTGSRFVGYERTDKEWLESGFASQEAKDKASGSKLVAALYQSKGLTEDRKYGVWQDEAPDEGDK